jgi:hypothetical protein
MGNQTKVYALVSMTNRDVYYLDRKSTIELVRMMRYSTADGTWVLQAVDAKSNKDIYIAVSHVSSVVGVRD